MKKRGFTLVEVMVVVAIMGILSAAGLPSIIKSLERAQVLAIHLDIQNFVKAVNLYYVDNGVYPDIKQWATPQLEPYLPRQWPSNSAFEERWTWAQVSPRLPYRILYIDLTPYGEKMDTSLLRTLQLVDEKYDDGSLSTGKLLIEKEILQYYIIDTGEDYDKGIGNEDDGIDLDNPGKSKDK